MICEGNTLILFDTAIICATILFCTLLMCVFVTVWLIILRKEKVYLKILEVKGNRLSTDKLKDELSKQKWHSKNQHKPKG